MSNHIGETEEVNSHLQLELNGETQEKKKKKSRTQDFITKKIQFKNRYAAAVSFHVHLKFLTVEFLEPTTLLRRRGLSNLAYLLNRAPLGGK